MLRRALSCIALMAVCAGAAISQDKPALPANTTDGAKLSYDVASIKPWDPNDRMHYGMPLRVYIQMAFGLSPNASGVVLGPDWINTARYVIDTKPPDAVRDAMKSMAVEQRVKTTQAMQQSLLAERFQLKAHFETREMPQYELVVAKGGPRMQEDPDKSKGQGGVSVSAIRGTAMPIHNLIDMLMGGVPEIGGRVIIDKTGLTGTYDFSLKWTPLQSAAPGDSNSPGASSTADGPSLFTAIDEQLGLKLVPTKGTAKVIVIDHIERPSGN